MVKGDNVMTRFFVAESVRISPGIRELQPLITSLALPQKLGSVEVLLASPSGWPRLPRRPSAQRAGESSKTAC